MIDDDAAVRDVLWKMYQEHCTQGRHHEVQRSAVISAVIAVCAALIGIITFDKTIAAPTDVPLAFLLIVLGAFGAGFSMKHYERFCLHMKRARAHRDALDSLLANRPLRRLKREADHRQEEEFPRLSKWRLHYWWLALNVVVALVGVVLLAISLWWPIPPAPGLAASRGVLPCQQAAPINEAGDERLMSNAGAACCSGGACLRVKRLPE